MTFDIEKWEDPPNEKMAVFIHVFKKTKHRSDIDNHAKSILDGLNEVLWEDDYLIEFLYTRMELDRKNPRALVAAMPLKEFNKNPMKYIKEWESKVEANRKVYIE